MDLRTGEIKDLKKILKKDLKYFEKITEKEMTDKQKTTKQVSLKDNKSPLGKKLQKLRKEKGYSQMSKNQKRNLRKRLKK